LCVADVVRQRRLRWFGHLEHKGKDEWVSACRNVFVTGARRPWEECEKLDLKLCALTKEAALNRDSRTGLIVGNHPNHTRIINGR